MVQFGSGKTASAVWECYQYYRLGYTIYSNIGLSFPHIKFTKRILEQKIKEKEGLQNAVILLDEGTIFMDSRTSMGKKNRYLSYFVLQTRKRNVRLIVTVQHMHQLDRRLRDTCDIICQCKNLSNKTSTVKEGQQTYIMQEYVLQWADESIKPKKKILYANPIFPLYDTREIVSFEEEEE